MEFSLTTLGVGSASPTSNRYPSAHVLNIRGRLFLIDCGEGCQMLLKRYHFSLLRFDCIFISHLHGDHIFGLPGLLSTMSMMGRTADLNVFAPEGFEQLLKFYLEQFGEGFKYRIVYHLLSGSEPVKIFETRASEVLSFPLYHAIPTFGFIFREKEPQLNVYKELIEPHNLTVAEIGKLKSGRDVVREDGTVLPVSKFAYKPFTPRMFAYCSDTAPYEKQAQWIKGADMIYHEATFAADMEDMAKDTFHSTTTQTASLAKDAGISKLVIGHFSSRYPNPEVLLAEVKAIFPKSYLAKEGEKFNV